MRYASAAATAHALLSRMGATATFSRTAGGTFDPVSQATTGATTTTFALPAVGLPPGKSAEARVGTLEGRAIQELHVAPSGGPVPAVGDKVRWAGADWTVIWAAMTDPAGDGAPYALAYVER